MKNYAMPLAIAFLSLGLMSIGFNLNGNTATATPASFNAGPEEPTIVWYDQTTLSTGSSTGWKQFVLFRAWSDGTIEGMKVQGNYQCQDLSVCGGGWTVLSSPQMACRTDIDGNGAVELGDLLAVLSQWGQEASCPDVVQLQCGLMHLR